MTAHYVSLIKNRSLSEISHEAGDGIAQCLSRGTAIIKEHNLLNLMDTSCSFWEVFDCFHPHKCPLKIKLLCYESCHPFGESLLFDCYPPLFLCRRVEIYLL